MKKMFNIVIILGVLALLYQFFIMLFVNKRNSNYSVLTDDDSYLIKEDYKREKDINMYTFLITDKEKNNFVYSYQGDLNKQSKVIKDVINYKKDNLNCIAPVFKNNKIENIVCKYNGELVSYTYLDQIGNVDVDNFIEVLSNSKYDFDDSFRKINNSKTDYQNISFYNDIDPNLYFTIWNYNSLYVINQKNTELKDLLNKDSYENTYAILDNKFYVVVDTDSSFNSFYVVNIKDGGKTKVSADGSVSNNIYYNGIYKNEIYFTDIENKKQYIINPAKEEINLLDTPKYYDGSKLKDVDISELTTEKKYFVKHIIPDTLKNKYGDSIIYSNQNYYYSKDGAVYSIIGNNYDYKVLLFKFDAFNEVKVLNGNVYGINKDTVYMYNNKIGLKKVLTNRELIYNYKNIFDVYEK